MMSISSPRIKVLHQYQVRILYNNLERDVSIKYEWCYVCTYVKWDLKFINEWLSRPSAWVAWGQRRISSSSWVFVTFECMSDLRTIPSKRVWCLPVRSLVCKCWALHQNLSRFRTPTAKWSTKGFHMSKSVSAWHGKIRESRQVTSMNVLIISPILLA